MSWSFLRWNAQPTAQQLAARELAEIVERTRLSDEVQSFRAHRAAQLKGRRQAT